MGQKKKLWHFLNFYNTWHNIFGFFSIIWFRKIIKQSIWYILKLGDIFKIGSKMQLFTYWNWGCILLVETKITILSSKERLTNWSTILDFSLPEVKLFNKISSNFDRKCNIFCQREGKNICHLICRLHSRIGSHVLRCGTLRIPQKLRYCHCTLQSQLFFSIRVINDNPVFRRQPKLFYVSNTSTTSTVSRPTPTTPLCYISSGAALATTCSGRRKKM